MKLGKIDLSGTEKNTFLLHLSYSVIEGLLEGLFLLNSFIFAKSLKGDAFGISLLFQTSVVLYLVSVFFNEFLKRVSNIKKWLRLMGTLTRLPLLLFAFFPSNESFYEKNKWIGAIFLIIFFLFYSSRTVIFPLINTFLRQNYRLNHFGTLYSLATTARKIVIVVSTFVFGLLLDWDHYAFKIIYPVSGLLGIAAIYLLTLIKYESSMPVILKQNYYQVVKQALQNMKMLVIKNRSFREFEISFMLYGLAFMTSFPLLSIYFDTILNLNYSSVAFYQYLFNIVAIIGLPFSGKLIDLIDTRSFGFITFASFGLQIVFFWMTDYFPASFSLFGLEIHYTLIASYVFYGVFVATMSLLFNIGSAYFAKNEDVSNYQATHLTLTGIRAAIFPFLGVWLYGNWGFHACFALGSIAITASLIVLRRSLKLTAHQTEAEHAE